MQTFYKFTENVKYLKNISETTLQYIIFNTIISTRYDTIRNDTIGEFNMDSKAEYSALSSTRSQKKKLKQTTTVPL